MTKNVRRLVLDISPGRGAFSLALWVVIALIDGLWLMRSMTFPSLAIVLIGIGPTQGFFAKTPIWRLLPLSPKEQGRTQWWILLGWPTFLITAAFIGSLIVVSALGRLRAEPADIFAVFAAQATVRAGCGFAILSFVEAGRLSPPRNFAYGLRFGVLLTLAGGLYLRLFGANPLTPMYVAGALTLIALAATYLCADALPLRASATPDMLAFLNRPAPDRSSGGAKGWATMIVPIARKFAFEGSLGLTILVVIYIASPWSGSLWPFHYLPAAGAIASYQALKSIPTRTLAGLPISSLKLTVLLQLLAPAAQLGAMAILLVSLGLLHPYLTPLFLPSQVALALLAIGCNAAFTPLWLRLGSRTSTIAEGGVYGGLYGLMIAASRGLFDARLMMAPALGLILVGWAWTYWELTRGRRAYRQRPAVASRWRNALG